MENLTVTQIEDLIVLTEEKMIGMREEDPAYREHEKMIGKLREMRLEMMSKEA